MKCRSILKLNSRFATQDDNNIIIAETILFTLSDELAENSTVDGIPVFVSVSCIGNVRWNLVVGCNSLIDFVYVTSCWDTIPEVKQ